MTYISTSIFHILTSVVDLQQHIMSWDKEGYNKIEFGEQTNRHHTLVELSKGTSMTMVGFNQAKIDIRRNSHPSLVAQCAPRPPCGSNPREHGYSINTYIHACMVACCYERASAFVSRILFRVRAYVHAHALSLTSLIFFFFRKSDA